MNISMTSPSLTRYFLIDELPLTVTAPSSINLAAADLVIARAGAMTLSELALMKKTCVLVPSPYVAENHQYKNAKTLADADAARVLLPLTCQAAAQIGKRFAVFFHYAKVKPQTCCYHGLTFHIDAAHAVR